MDKIIVHGSSGAGAGLETIIIENHESAGNQTRVNEFATILNRTEDIDIDVRERYPVRFQSRKRFGNEALMQFNETGSEIPDALFYPFKRAIGEVSVGVNIESFVGFRHALERIEKV